MLRKIFSILLMAVIILFAANSSVLAASNLEVKNISVIMEPPIESFDKPEKVHDSVQQTVNKIFKYSTYNVMSIDETAGYVQVYREENGFDSADAFLKMTDLDNICQHLGSDYVIYIRISSNGSKNTDILNRLEIGTKGNVVLDFRVWSNSQKNFIYTKRTTKTDYFVEALNKGLQEVEKDSSKIRAAMEDRSVSIE